MELKFMFDYRLSKNFKQLKIKILFNLKKKDVKWVLFGLNKIGNLYDRQIFFPVNNSD